MQQLGLQRRVGPAPQAAQAGRPARRPAPLAAAPRASWVPDYGLPSRPGATSDKHKALTSGGSGNGSSSTQQRKWWNYQAATAEVGRPGSYVLRSVRIPELGPGGGGGGGGGGGRRGGGGGGGGGGDGMKAPTYLFSFLLAAGGLTAYVRRGSTTSLFVTSAVVTLLLVSASLMGHPTNRSGTLLALATTLVLSGLMGAKACASGRLALTPASVVSLLSFLMSAGYVRTLASGDQGSCESHQALEEPTSTAEAAAAAVLESEEKKRGSKAAAKTRQEEAKGLAATKAEQDEGYRAEQEVALEPKQPTGRHARVGGRGGSKGGGHRAAWPSEGAGGSSGSSSSGRRKKKKGIQLMASARADQPASSGTAPAAEQQSEGSAPHAAGTEAAEPTAAESPSDNEAEAELAQLMQGMGVSEAAARWGEPAPRAAASADPPAGAGVRAAVFITQESLRGPVLAADGSTHERTTIKAWIARERAGGRASTFHMTGQPLEHLHLTPVLLRWAEILSSFQFSRSSVQRAGGAMDVAEWYKQLPPITRGYVTLCVLTTAACALEVITPFHIYFNSRLILQKREFWRVLTNFFYFGNLGLDFFFHMFFLVRYSKSLEEGSFRNRTADFLWMLLFGAGLLVAVAPFVNIQFLGSSLSFMMVYVWGRRHQYVNLSFLGIFTFTAPYLPWVLLGFSTMLGSSPLVDALGMAAGHAYYFLEDVYPRMVLGRRPLRTPAIVCALFPQQQAIHAAAAAAAAGADRLAAPQFGGDAGAWDGATFLGRALPESVTIVEVGPRDGLQNEATKVPTEVKVQLIEMLAGAGLPAVESTSFVSPKWVPQLADAADVLARVRRRPGVRYPVLTPNMKGFENALKAGATEVAIFTAASEAFCRKNTNCRRGAAQPCPTALPHPVPASPGPAARASTPHLLTLCPSYPYACSWSSIDESLRRFDDVVAAAKREGVAVRGYVSCVVGCPYQGEVAPQEAARVAQALHEMGCYEVSMGDTIGVGTPASVAAMFEACKQVVPVQQLAAHMHDTYGMAVANILASLQASGALQGPWQLGSGWARDLSVAVVDSSVAGLGGCPYARGATGNVATEDVVYLLDGFGIRHGVDMGRLLDASDFICSFLGHRNNSRAAEALLATRGAAAKKGAAQAA
eukprot:scaffold1.g5582.t1